MDKLLKIIMTSVIKGKRTEAVRSIKKQLKKKLKMLIIKELR